MIASSGLLAKFTRILWAGLIRRESLSDPIAAENADAVARHPASWPAVPKRKPSRELAQSHPALRDQAWETWRIKDGEKGPIVWKVKHAMLYVKDEDSLPTKCCHLLVCDNPLTGERKYFISNAPAGTPLKKLLQVAFSRWPIEPKSLSENP